MEESIRSRGVRVDASDYLATLTGFCILDRRLQSVEHSQVVVGLGDKVRVYANTLYALKRNRSADDQNANYGCEQQGGQTLVIPLMR